MHKAMLQTGVVQYGEILIARPLEHVWEALAKYYEWAPVHAMGTRTTIEGERGQVGEIVEVLKAGAAKPVFVQTVRIRPPQAIVGSHRAGNMVWKVYDQEVSFSRFSDFGVRDYLEQTILYRSVYTELAPGSDDFARIRREQAQGEPDSVAIEEVREQIEAFIARTRGA